MTEPKRKTKADAEGDDDVASPEGEELGGPVHEQGYTEETAKQHQEDFGRPVPEVGLEGRGVPGVS